MITLLLFSLYDISITTYNKSSPLKITGSAYLDISSQGLTRESPV